MVRLMVMVERAEADGCWLLDWGVMVLLTFMDFHWLTGGGWLMIAG